MLAWLGDWAEAASWWTAVATFLLVAAIETIRPHRPLTHNLAFRWAGHFALYGVCLALLGIAAPISRTGDLFGADERLLFAALDRAGEWAVLVGGLLALDLFTYALHRTQHQVFLLWRFHAVHHADTDVDLSTGLRHHPGEAVVNACVITVVLFALGAPGWLFPVYAVISFSSSLFQHMNARLPEPAERFLEYVVVTPAMHRIHHSLCPEHFGTNFGNVLSIWDRLFGTYLQLANAQAAALCFGVPGFTSPRHARPYFAWLMPFVLRREQDRLMSVPAVLKE